MTDADPEVAALIERAGQTTLQLREHDELRRQRDDLYRQLRQHLTLAEIERELHRWLVEHGVPEAEVAGLGVRMESIRKAAPGRRR